MTVIGRIDIKFPDGRSASRQLEDAAITFGSAADNTVRVAEAGIAAHHFRFSQQDKAAYLTNLDVYRGLYIDGVPVPVNEPQRLQNVAHIRAGELHIDFYPRNDSPTVAMPALTDHTQPMAAGFRASLASGEIKVWRYSSASTEVSVTNLTEKLSQFTVETAGLPDGWTTPGRLTFSVDGGDTTDVLIQIKPSRRADIAPGGYPLTVTVTRLGEHEQAAIQLTLLVQLGGYGGLSLALDPPASRDRSAFSLFLLNLGNEDLRLALRACDPDEQLNLKLAQENIRLSAGGRAVISGMAEMRRRPIIGRATDISFALLAKADDPNNYLVALPASVTVKPVLANRLLIAAALAFVVFALALAAALYQQPQPEIASYTLSEWQVARGTPVELTWEATDAQRYVIEVDRAPIAELRADETSFILDTGGYVDPVEIALIAANGDATDIESRRLDVYQPVIVTRFEASKSTMLRNIRSALTINWRVEGAIALDIARPLGFETMRESKARDAEGEIVLRGEPADKFHITLTAVDETGAKTELTIPIAIREPECTPMQDTLLFAGPDSRFQRVSFALRNVPVLVNGITKGKDWLQVELASGDRGWGFHSNFYCHGFDPSALRVISDLPQLPTPTDRPQPTATATHVPIADDS